ncbi:MAG TPA: AAA family ATPase, partial [Sedimentisphaerales bacterium]|nr:AAA family ATPase [Sedimentisphaerales bacterium]
MAMDIKQISDLVLEKSQFVRTLFAELDKVIVGQRYMLERMLIGLLADGHILLEGVPGLAKTMAVTVLAKAINANFKRIQFTPDLLPADLIGTQIYRQSDGQFFTRKGPLFANI